VDSFVWIANKMMSPGQIVLQQNGFPHAVNINNTKTLEEKPTSKNAVRKFAA
jgi:hypothetical protein